MHVTARARPTLLFAQRVSTTNALPATTSTLIAMELLQWTPAAAPPAKRVKAPSMSASIFATDTKQVMSCARPAPTRLPAASITTTTLLAMVLRTLTPIANRVT